MKTEPLDAYDETNNDLKIQLIKPRKGPTLETTNL